MDPYAADLYFPDNINAVIRIYSLFSAYHADDTDFNCFSNMRSFDFLPRCMKCRRGLAMRILSVCPSVRLSVCLSVTRVNCNKTVERSVQIYILYETSFSLVF